MIMSIIFPDRGELSVLGKSSAVESKDRIGYLPEERGVYRKMKAGPFLAYMAKLKGVHSRGLEAKVKQWLDRVGLADCYKKRCEELSKGMQQKVQFVASVIHEPDLVILDEPFSGLDPVNRRLLRSLIDEQHRLGRTLIFSTHAMFEAEQLCTHLFMINQGNKVLDMPIEQVWRTYDPRVIHVERLGAATLAEAAADGELFRSLPGVASVDARGASFDLRLHDDADIGTIMARVVERAPVRRVELRRPNLEDVFIQLVGGDAAALRAELRDRGGEAGLTPDGAGAAFSEEGVES
jgi:ABC-2 type transport system ATP-binding protein